MVRHLWLIMKMDSSTIESQNLIEQMIAQFDQTLRANLPSSATNPSCLHQAIHYTLYNGGKRVRPLLVYFTGQVFNTPIKYLHYPACAVELIHAYSLVHDDLPAMDDDDFRRGKPSCHKAYDEATAILVGDALQALAFELLSSASFEIPAEKKLAMIQQLSVAAGSQGMVGGQSLDLLSEGKQLDLTALNQLHQKKTGALIQAAVELGILAANNVTSEEAEHLREFSKCLGLAFQIRDDIKDIEGDLDSLGKQPGGDIVKQKATYPAILGLDDAKESFMQLHQDAIHHLSPFDEQAVGLRSLLESLFL
jgi:farnesyl diphosphate synthase